MAVTLDQVVFVGFNKRVIALDQNCGAFLWDWKCPKGSGYVTLLLTDERHLIVSVSGYTYCLDPATGEQQWFNELKGYGSGVTSLAAWGALGGSSLTAAAEEEQAAAAAAAGAAT
jgi:outer membrane protein assembly factor BamB